MIRGSELPVQLSWLTANAVLTFRGQNTAPEITGSSWSSWEPRSLGAAALLTAASTLNSPGCHQLHVPPALVLLGLCCWLWVRASMLKMVQVHLWHLFWCLLSAMWALYQLMGSARKDQHCVRSTTQGTRAQGQGRERSSYGLVAEEQNEATSRIWSGLKDGTKETTCRKLLWKRDWNVGWDMEKQKRNRRGKVGKEMEVRLGRV